MSIYRQAVEEYQLHLKKSLRESEKTIPRSLRNLKRSVLIVSNPNMRKMWKERIKILSLIADAEATINFLLNIEENRMYSTALITESESLGAVMREGPVSSMMEEKYENVIDVSGQVADNEVSGFSSNSSQGQKELLDIQGFLSRPIPIANFQIPTSTDVSVIYDVWDLYTLNPAMRAKLRNYAYLRGNLHIRIAISGTPFHYGRMLASYQPYPDRNENIINHLSSVAFDANWRPLFLNYLSQSEGAVAMDVRDNQPVDLVCPFISTKPMHRLYNDSALVIGSSTSFQDLEEAGSLFFYSINQVKSTSATPSDVSVYIYAWMTEVELGTSTATQVGIVTESEVVSDERETGPVEKIASRLSSVADMMSAVPVIGPYATASKVVLGALGRVSAIFGWSKPIPINDPILVKNCGFQNGANVIGQDTNFRITLDPKQELTVDPRVIGSGDDEMTIAHIAKRESYLTTFSWNDDSAVMASPLWISCVNPSLCTEFTDIAGDWLQPTALAFSAAPFLYWRGTIKFRFDIVASQFHRGKLAFFFEPNAAQFALINADIDTNKQYMRIIDIQETQSVTFCVNWAHPRAWAKSVNSTQIKQLHGPAVLPSVLAEYVNGYIGVVPLTTLQSPDDSDISINVFVSSDDMNYNMFSEMHIPGNRELITESEVINTHEVTCYELNDSSASAQHISEEHFGEQPVSFRALCKRYAKTSDQAFGANASTMKVIQSRFNTYSLPAPLYSGTTPNLTLYGYLRYAYVGIRGGMRKRLHHWVDSQSSNVTQCKVTLDNPLLAVIPGTAILTTPQAAVLSGTVSFLLTASGGIEAEIPFYSNNLFAFSFADDLIGANSANDMIDEWSKSYTVSLDAGGATDAGFVIEESATAEDFSFLRYQGAPFFRIAA